MKKSDNVINIQLSDNQGKLHIRIAGWYIPCLLYTSDAADE